MRLEIWLENGKFYLKEVKKFVVYSIRPIAFIETEKKVYKSNEIGTKQMNLKIFFCSLMVFFMSFFYNEVRVRLLALDFSLRPVHNEIFFDKLVIRDPTGTIFYQLNDIVIENGLFEFEFPLANEPNEGQWKISLLARKFFGSDALERFFSVNTTHQLPGFNVTLDHNSMRTPHKQLLKFHICSR